MYLHLGICVTVTVHVYIHECVFVSMYEGWGKSGCCLKSDYATQIYLFKMYIILSHHPSGLTFKKSVQESTSKWSKHDSILINM